MYRKSFSIGLLVAFLLLLLLSFMFASAAPMPPRPVVNHQARQCAVIVPGDECGDVILPAGWEYLDDAAGERCPEGYSTIELHPDWTKFKVAHCCMEGHSGVAGDCQDVVIHQSNRQCAFVEDIQACVDLPNGWEAWGKNCPTDFEWVDQVVCPGSQVGQTQAPTPPSQVEPTSTTSESNPTMEEGGRIGTPESTKSPSTRNNLLPCPSAAMVLVVIACAAYLRRR